MVGGAVLRVQIRTIQGVPITRDQRPSLRRSRGGGIMGVSSQRGPQQVRGPTIGCQKGLY